MAFFPGADDSEKDGGASGGVSVEVALANSEEAAEIQKVVASTPASPLGPIQNASETSDDLPLSMYSPFQHTILMDITQDQHLYDSDATYLASASVCS